MQKEILHIYLSRDSPLTTQLLQVTASQPRGKEVNEVGLTKKESSNVSPSIA